MGDSGSAHLCSFVDRSCTDPASWGSLKCSADNSPLRASGPGVVCASLVKASPGPCPALSYLDVLAHRLHHGRHLTNAEVSSEVPASSEQTLPCLVFRSSSAALQLLFCEPRWSLHFTVVEIFLVFSSILHQPSSGLGVLFEAELIIYSVNPGPPLVLSASQSSIRKVKDGDEKRCRQGENPP